MQVVKELPLLSETPMLKREVSKATHKILSLFKVLIVFTVLIIFMVILCSPIYYRPCSVRNFNCAVLFLTLKTQIATCVAKSSSERPWLS